VKLGIHISLSMFFAASAIAAACTLNPQPLPPDAPDGSTPQDGSAKSANLSDDATAAPPQDEADAGTVNGPAPDVDGGDSSTSGEGDAGDGGAIDDANDAG
jgi:hypothetical protein